MHSHSCTIVALSVALFFPAANAADVAVGVSVAGQITPGVYGRIDIGNTAPPPLLYPQPVIIAQPVHPVAAAPVYLHVPPGHAKKWNKHCHKYNACAQPVYFIKSAEYGGSGKGGKPKKHKHGHDD